MVFVSAVVPPAAISSRARCFIVQGSALWVRGDAGVVVLPLVAEMSNLGFQLERGQYLGQLDGEDCFAFDAKEAAPPEPWRLEALRALHGMLDDDAFGVAGRALQITEFAVNHRHCGRCGQPTEQDLAERSRRCRSCSLAFYPRIAPAIIVLVRRGKQALLARAARFTSNFYSALARFVEPGESLEQTLVREVREEVGIEVGGLRYFGSQPWPFPHSLMVGFTAEHVAGEIAVDGQEIVDARWFDAWALPPIPPKLSIARRLIDAWVHDVTIRR